MTAELRHGIATVGLFIGLLSVVFGAACHGMMIDRIARSRGARIGALERMGMGGVLLILEYRRVSPRGRLHWFALAAGFGGMALLLISGHFGWGSLGQS